MLEGLNTRASCLKRYVLPVLRRLPCLCSMDLEANEAIYRCLRAGKNAMTLKEREPNEEPDTGGESI